MLWCRELQLQFCHHKPGFAGAGRCGTPSALHREGAVWGDLQGESHREQEVSRNKWLVGV